MNESKVKQEILSNTVENHEGCWLWTKSTFDSGYGQKKVSGKNWRVHKLSYLLFNGRIPNKMVVRHRCGNRICCNPNHLEVGTLKQNSQDTIKHGRCYFSNKDQVGSNNHKAVLNESLVYKLRLNYLDGLTMREISEKHSISRKTVERAVRGKSYSNFNKIPPIPSKRCN